MIIETREEYLKRIGERLGDSDEDIAFLEDMTDTYDSLSGGSQEEIQRLTSENEELRRKYKERFFTPGKDDKDKEDPETDPEEVEIKTKFEELFTEGSI